MSEVKFFSHGACQEVTGSKHFLQGADWLIELDCGMFQGRRAETYLKNKNFTVESREISAVILSHAHYDHSGALPVLVRKGFNGKIFATAATRDLASIILQDSAHIQQTDFNFLKQKKSKHPEYELTLYEPLYDQQDVFQTMARFFTFSYKFPFAINKNFEFYFLDAGHILGSAITVIKTTDLRIAFSGDLGRKNLPLINDPALLPEIDVLIVEGTYGNRRHKPFAEAEEEIVGLIRKAVGRKSKIIIPAFTVERTQELLYIIHKLYLENRIEEIPIYVDSPMAINATSVFTLHSDCFDQETRNLFLENKRNPFKLDNIFYIQSSDDSKKLNSLRGPAIIISASGMAESGRILHHLANNIENPDNIIAIVGFMAAETLGRKIVEKRPQVKILGNTYQLKAEVATLNAFSAHADYPELINWLIESNLYALKKIFLVHGEKEALFNLKNELEKVTAASVEIVQQGKIYNLC